MSEPAESAPRAFLNPAGRGAAKREAPALRALAFHRRLPGYRPSPLRDLPALARELGVGAVLAKDESERLGLPAFKVLGGSWAGFRALEERLDARLEDWSDLADLGARVRARAPELTLTTATAGNHGRGVAWFARQVGLAARIVVPAGTAPARIDALQDEGADVVIHPGSYDEAVEMLERAGDPNVKSCSR